MVELVELGVESQRERRLARECLLGGFFEEMK